MYSAHRKNKENSKYNKSNIFPHYFIFHKSFPPVASFLLCNNYTSNPKIYHWQSAIFYRTNRAKISEKEKNRIISDSLLLQVIFKFTEYQYILRQVLCSCFLQHRIFRTYCRYRCGHLLVYDWDAQYACALDPETAKAIRDSRKPEDDHSDTCSCAENSVL